MMSWNGGAGWLGWLLMSLGMVAFWVLVALAIMALLPGVQKSQPEVLPGLEPGPAPQDAERVLDESDAK